MTNKSVSVCIITPSLKLGGLENAVSVLANYFSRKGYSVFIITIYGFRHFYTLHKSIKVIEPSYSKSKTPKLWYYLKTIFFLRKSIKRVNPDVILSYGDYINALVLLANIGLRFPCYISDRSSPGKRFPFTVSLMRKILYRKAQGIIAQTSTALLQKKKMLGENSNVTVIPNPIRPIEKHPGVNRENIILAVGRHYHVKGLDRLIRAFAMVNSNGWRLEIAGSQGPVTPELKELTKELNLENKVVFLGSVKEIDQVYARSKIFVLPSRSEGFPNALIEAMAHGLACISFDINAGPSDIISNGKNGILVPDNNIALLAENISYLINNEKEQARLGKVAEELLDILSLDIIGGQLESFLFNQNGDM